jgi:hypothetical protein
MSDEDLGVLQNVIDLQQRRGDDLRSMTQASRHMRAAAGLIENLDDERAVRATTLLLEAARLLVEIERPR